MNATSRLITSGLLKPSASAVAALTCSIALLLCPTRTSSQEASDVIQLEPIVVSGQKIERDLQDTNGSVTVVVPGEGLAGAASNVLELTERLPNVEPFAGDRGFAIRGVGQSGFGFSQGNYLLTRGPSDLVATYIDGIPVSAYAAPFSFWDVEQIEVHRGAQSTLLGRGSLGGAVVMETNDPDFELGGVAQLSYGTEGAKGLSFAGGSTLVEDRLAFRMALDGRDGPRFNDNVTTGGEEDRDDLRSARLKLLYAGDEGADVELSAFRSQATVGTRFVDAAAWPDRRISRADVSDRLVNDAIGLSLRGTWELNDTLSLETATVGVNEDAKRSLDPDATEVPTGAISLDNDVVTLSQEVRLRYEADRFEGFLGFYYEDFDGDSGSASGFASTAVDQDIRTMALFGEGTWSATERLDLIFGLRAEREENDTRVQNTLAGPGGPIPVNVSTSDEFSILLPKLGVSYQATDQIRLYATVQRGYRAGGAGASLFGTAFSFDPETTVNYDLGLRHESADGRLRVGANLFFVDWKDQQLAVPAGTGVPFDTVTQNVGRSESYGLELDTAFAVNDQLSLFGAFGLQKTEIKEAGAANAALVGNSFTAAPEMSLSLGGRYAFDNGLDFSLSANWRDSYYSDLANSELEEVGDRLLVDASIGYSFYDTRIELAVTNLLDEEYLNFSDRATLAGTPGLNSEGIVAPGPGRAVLLTLRHAF